MKTSRQAAHDRFRGANELVGTIAMAFGQLLDDVLPAARASRREGGWAGAPGGASGGAPASPTIPGYGTAPLSIAREALAPERSGAEVTQTLERLGQQRGLGGGFTLGLRELISYASASPDPAQGALDAELEAVAVARRIVRPVFRARLQANGYGRWRSGFRLRRC